MKLLLSSKVESVKFSESVQQSKSKIKESESNITFMKVKIKRFQENHQHLPNHEKLIPVFDNKCESNVNTEMLINDNVSIATKISKSIK